MSKKNFRRISTLVSAQTLYHLESMRRFHKYKDIGQVIDKLVREKQISLSRIYREYTDNDTGREVDNHDRRK
jgi:hypothetical protein